MSTRPILITFLSFPLYFYVFYFYIFIYSLCIDVVWDSVVGMATGYRFGGLGIESHWGRDIPHPFMKALGLTQSPVKWALGLFPWNKSAAEWR
jgi:hypothetical protein